MATLERDLFFLVFFHSHKQLPFGVVQRIHQPERQTLAGLYKQTPPIRLQCLLLFKVFFVIFLSWLELIFNIRSRRAIANLFFIDNHCVPFLFSMFFKHGEQKNVRIYYSLANDTKSDLR